MRTLSFVTAGLTGFAIALVALAYLQSAGAQSAAENGQGEHGFGQNVMRTVENIDNGTLITMTSDDTEAMEKLQAKEFRTPQNDAVEKTIENIDNGIRITVTSDDVEEVEHIQTHAAEGKKGGHGIHGRGHKGNRKMQNVIREVESIENGVVMTLTSDDEDVVTKHQSKEFPEPRDEDVEKAVKIIDNGIRISITSGVSETIKRIQSMKEYPHGGRRGHGRPAPDTSETDAQ